MYEEKVCTASNQTFCYEHLYQFLFISKQTKHSVQLILAAIKRSKLTLSMMSCLQLLSGEHCCRNNRRLSADFTLLYDTITVSRPREETYYICTIILLKLSFKQNLYKRLLRSLCMYVYLTIEN